MAVLHSLRPEAWAAALKMLARHQGYDRLEHAETHGGSFDLDEILDVWSPQWRQSSPPAGMGPRSRQLFALTYCVFVGVWEGEVGFVLSHPDQLPPKSVTVSFLRKNHDHESDPRRALLSIRGRERVLVPFPNIPSVLLAPARTHRFAESREALDALAATMVERVNLLTPAALLLGQEGP